MASVINGADTANKFTNYPANINKLTELNQKDTTAFVIAKVVRVFQATKALEEGNVEGSRPQSFFVELRDESGSGNLMLRNPSRLDSQRETEAMENCIKFFEGKEGKLVYILNAKVKFYKYPKINKSFTLLILDQWSQLRDITNEEIIADVTNRIANPQQHSQPQAEQSRPLSRVPKKRVERETPATSKETEGETKKPREKREPLSEHKEGEKKKPREKLVEIVNLKDITPNNRIIDIVAKVVEVFQFKRLKGFLANAECGEEEEKNNYLRITLADNTGKIYCVLPALDKFNEFKTGNVLHLHRAIIERFEGDIQNEVQIFSTIYIKEKVQKKPSTITVLEGEAAQKFADIPVIESSTGEIKKDNSNVSHKVWIVQLVD